MDAAWQGTGYWSDSSPISAFQPSGLLPDSGAIMPGRLATAQERQYENDKRRLIELVGRFFRYGFSQTAGIPEKISELTADRAIRFFRLLPSAKDLPQIAPDGEGGMMMVWEQAQGPLLISIEGSRLDVVVRATTLQAEYLDEISFHDNNNIPDKILDLIPSH